MPETLSEICQKLNACISKYIRPLTFPVAIKYYKKGEAIPARARIPTKTLGFPIAFCQAVSIARKYGWILALYQQDQACPLSQIILGYGDEPDFIKGGSVIKPLYAETDEAAAKTEASTPKMPTPDTYCIVCAPLDKATFDPDVVVCYGNSAQITRFVQGALYKVGGYIESKFAGRCACGAELTVPFLENKCNVILPGGGERVFALTGDDEVAFAMPRSMIENVMYGIEATHKNGVARIPTPPAGLLIKPAFPKYYWKLEEHFNLRKKE